MPLPWIELSREREESGAQEGRGEMSEGFPSAASPAGFDPVRTSGVRLIRSTARIETLTRYRPWAKEEQVGAGLRPAAQAEARLARVAQRAEQAMGRRALGDCTGFSPKSPGHFLFVFVQFLGKFNTIFLFYLLRI